MGGQITGSQGGDTALLMAAAIAATVFTAGAASPAIPAAAGAGAAGGAGAGAGIGAGALGAGLGEGAALGFGGELAAGGLGAGAAGLGGEFAAAGFGPSAVGGIGAAEAGFGPLIGAEESGALAMGAPAFKFSSLMPTTAQVGTFGAYNTAGQLAGSAFRPQPETPWKPPATAVPAMTSGSTRGYQPTTNAPIQMLANLMAQRRQESSQRRWA